MQEKGELSYLHRREADLLLKNICLQDGMPKLLANMVYIAVRTYSNIRYGM